MAISCTHKIFISFHLLNWHQWECQQLHDQAVLHADEHHHYIYAQQNYYYYYMRILRMINEPHKHTAITETSLTTHWHFPVSLLSCLISRTINYSEKKFYYGRWDLLQAYLITVQRTTSSVVKRDALWRC